MLTWRSMAFACHQTSRWSRALQIQTSWWPLAGGIYLHPQILALGLKLPLTNFVRDILCHFKVVPSQLLVGAWCIILGFKDLCVSFVPNSCRHEELYAIYSMRKTNKDDRFFIPQSGCDRLIINLVDNDHGWRDTVILGLGRRLLQKAEVSFQPRGVGDQSHRGVCHSKRRSGRRCGGCSKLIMIFTTEVSCWIWIGPLCFQSFWDLLRWLRMTQSLPQSLHPSLTREMLAEWRPT